MRLMKQIKNGKGFSLIELMVVLAIIGILAGFAIPSYQNQMQKGRASSAQGDLMNLAARTEVYRQGNLSYNGATAAGVYSATSPSDASEPHFNLNVAVINNGRDYRLSAMPVPGSRAAGDGTFWYNPKGKSCWFPDNDAAGYSPTCAGGQEWE